MMKHTAKRHLRLRYGLPLTWGVAAMLCTACSGPADPPVPLASGQYTFQHRYAEHPTMPSMRVTVTIRGTHITVTNPVAADPFPAGDIAEGQLMWHGASAQWIISEDDADRLVQDVGGCSDGPEVVDLEEKIYWTC